jgi:hypothetical protein
VQFTVIKFVGSALGNPTDADGKYLRAYVPEPHGRLVVCDDPADAQRFAFVGDAIGFWRQAYGTRPDGRPNRPLTAWTVDLETYAPPLET